MHLPFNFFFITVFVVGSKWFTSHFTFFSYGFVNILLVTVPDLTIVYDLFIFPVLSLKLAGWRCILNHRTVMTRCVYTSAKH